MSDFFKNTPGFNSLALDGDFVCASLMLKGKWTCSALQLPISNPVRYFSKNGYKRCLMPEKCCIDLLISCRELVDKNPSAHTCLLLGDAYMSIQEVSEGCAYLKLQPLKY